MNHDATGRPLPPWWGKPRRRRSHAYRLRRAMRRLARWRRIRDGYHERMVKGEEIYNLWEHALFRCFALATNIRKMGGRP